MSCKRVIEVNVQLISFGTSCNRITCQFLALIVLMLCNRVTVICIALALFNVALQGHCWLSLLGFAYLDVVLQGLCCQRSALLVWMSCYKVFCAVSFCLASFGDHVTGSVLSVFSLPRLDV